MKITNFKCLISLSSLVFIIVACGTPLLEESDAGAQYIYSDAGIVNCDREPTTCEDIGDEAAQHYGCCLDDLLFYCKAELFTEGGIDCTANGSVCGYNAVDDFMDCIY